MIVKEKAINSQKKEYTLSYELVSTEFIFEGEKYKGYGIKLEESDENGKTLCNKTIYNMTTKKSSACNFIELVTRNFVTPDTIDDVVEDFLA